ncbi:MAG: type II secretion system F family protein [Spirochaetales bacterium]|nr:type II secretion system F family protein [Spirochaetales bacterium]
MIYNCRISDSQGKILRKKIQAESSDELESRFKEQGYYLLEWEEEASPKRLRGRQNKAILELTQSLALMIQSGLSLKEAFEVSQGLFRKGKTALLVEQLNRQLQRGDSFAQAIASQQDLFPPLYLGMIRVGQRLGQLDKILTPLAGWLKERKELRDKITGALIYPALVLSMMFVGVTALLVFFLPQMESLTSMAGGSSSENLERAMGSARGLILVFGGTVILIPLLVAILHALMRRNKSLRIMRDNLILTIPLIRRFYLIRDMLSLSFALSILTECGVSLEDSLVQAADVLENQYLRDRLLSLQSRLLKGDSLSALLESEPIFPHEFSRWVGLGERIGSVDKIFKQLKDYYQQEMQKILNNILTLVEPVVIILLGVILLTVILNVILPLLTMYGGMG